MAETVSLYLKANGMDIKGESTQRSLGREDSIECVHFDHAVSTAREAGSGMATGRRRYEPILIRKRIDKSTPLLFKAMVENQKIDATFKFFRPNPNGDGTTEQFYSVDIKDGRISGMRDYVPDCIDPVSSNDPPMEEVRFVFHTIVWTYTNGGVTHQDSWSENR
jgi:type VI secretion system secreted protein Hcp